MKRILLPLWLVCCFNTLPAFSQYLPLSPEATSIVGAVENPVSMSSGITNVNIPLFNFTVKDIPISFDLNYLSSGIRVSEEASAVGLGWRLGGPGAIVQVVKSKNDLEPGGSLVLALPDPNATRPQPTPEPTIIPCNNGIGPYDYNYGPKWQCAFCPAPGNASDCWGNTFRYDYAQNNPLTFQDNEPDAFYYSFLGYSGVFYYNLKKEVIKVYKNNLLFDYSFTNKTFKVTTDNGLQLFFEEKEVSETPLLYSNAQNGYQSNVVKNVGTTWYLSKITSLSSNESVTFGYYTSPANTSAVYIFQEYWMEPNQSDRFQSDRDLTCNAPQPTGTTCDQALWQTSIGLKTTEIVVNRKIKYLSEVNFSSGKIEFLLGTREDLPNGKKVDEIKLSNKQGTTFSHVKSFKFNYSYFLSKPEHNPIESYHTTNIVGVNAVLNKRLKLLSVSEYSPLQNSSTDNRKAKPYTFSYNEPSDLSLPYKTSFDIDEYGFYNWNTSRTSHNRNLTYFRINVPIKTTHPQSSLVGMLKSITTPLGGVTSYEFETMGTFELGLARVKKVTQQAAENNTSITKWYEYVGETDLKVSKHKNVYGVLVKYGCNSNICANAASCLVWAFKAQNNLSINGSIAQNTSYTKVVEHLGVNDESGKIEYNFKPSSKLDIYPIDKVPTCTTAVNCSLPPGYPIFIRPNVIQVISQVVYRKNSTNLFDIVSKEEYDYDYSEELTNCVGVILYEQNTCSAYGSLYYSYKIPSFTINLKEKRSYIYDQNVQSRNNFKTTQYFYNPLNLLPNRIIETTSDPNKKYIKQLNYASDYTGGNTTIATLKTNNLVSVPVEELTLEQITSGTTVTSNVLGGSLIEYSPDAIGLPLKVHSLEYGAPKPCSTFTTSTGYNACNVSVGGTYLFNSDYKLQKTYGYDGAKNIVQVTGKAGLSSSKQWGYNGQNVTATFENASKDQTAYAGFESGLDQGWQNDDPLVNTESKTGFWSVKIDKSSTTNFGPSYSILPTSQKGKYKFGAWVKYNGASTNGVIMHFYSTKKSDLYGAAFPAGAAYTSTLITNTQGKWKYFELELDLDAIKTIAAVVNMNPKEDLGLRASLSNADPLAEVYVDDMIIFPSTSVATSYTYEPLVGLKSVSKQDGSAIYYEYDHLGMPYLIKDLDGNILKKKEILFKQ